MPVLYRLTCRGTVPLMTSAGESRTTRTLLATVVRTELEVLVLPAPSVARARMS